MATQLQLRRGTNAQVTAFTGAEGEVSVNTTNDSLHIHDGSTAGGFELARADLNNVSDTDLNAALTGNTVSALTVTALTSSGIDVTGTVTADGAVISGDTAIGTTVTSGVILDVKEPSTGADAIVGVTGHGSNRSQIRATHTLGTSSDLRFLTADAGNTRERIKLASNGDISFYEDTGTTPKFFWDASNEGLGLGTTSPATGYRLDISGNSGYDDIMRITGVGTNIGPRINLTPTGTGISRINATANSLQLQTSGTAALTIDSSQNVGIGTSSPSATLALDKSTGQQHRALDLENNSITYSMYVDQDNSSTNSWSLFDTTNLQTTLRYLPSSSGYWQFYTNGTERMRIDSSGRVGIGTSSPDALLEINKGSEGEYLKVGGDNVSNGRSLTFTSSASSSGSVGALHTIKSSSVAGEIAFANGDGTIMYLKDGGNVGIGTSSPREKVHLHGGTSSTQLLMTGGGLNSEVYGGFIEGDGVSGQGGHLRLGVLDAGTERVGIEIEEQGNQITFDTAGTERMRIDASGNLLVGTTTVNGAGVTLGAGNYGYFSRSGDATLFANRSTSDGDIIELRKADVKVGSIGSSAGNSIFVGSGDVGVRFSDTNNAIYPMTTGGINRDAATDLGLSTVRFKDLYLSGGAYLGGVTSANHLDDYEEGTWTPEYAAATAFTSITYDSLRYGKYTKVGNLVHIQGILRTDAISGGSGTVTVTGLPFSIAGGEFSAITIGYSSSFAGDRPAGLYTLGGGTSMSIRYRTTANGGLDSSLAVGDLDTGANSNYIVFAGTYITNA